MGPVDLTVGSSFGGTPDVMMRLVAAVLTETRLVDNEIVVTNRPGGSWTVVSDYLLSQRGNENLLVAIAPTLFTTPVMQNRPAVYDRLTPIALLMRMNLVLVTRADGPDADLAALVKRARTAGPEAISFGGANVGTTDHIVAALIDAAAGTAFRYVPFDGGGEALMAAFRDGAVDVVVLTLAEAAPMLADGQARALAVLSDQRIDLGPYGSVATAREQGVDVVWNTCYGIAGPPHLPKAAVAWWNDRLARMVATDAWQRAMAEAFLVTDHVPAEAIGPVLDAIDQQYRSVLKDLKLANN